MWFKVSSFFKQLILYWSIVEQTLGNSEGQGSLACCSPGQRPKEADVPEQLSNNK